MRKPVSRRAAAGKPGLKADKGPRWTVRGVGKRLQKAAGDAARAEGVTLGVWLSGLIADATEGGVQNPAADVWRVDVERRLTHLEGLLLAGDGPLPARSGGVAPVEDGPSPAPGA